MKEMFTKQGRGLPGLLALLLYLVSSAVMAQETIVSGTVKDDAKNGLPGVNVIVKGTTNGTTTDENGAYRLAVPDASATVIFSFIGYQTQEIAVGQRTQVDIVLLPDVKNLSEVVVVG
jgi:hypothetical protein